MMFKQSRENEERVIATLYPEGFKGNAHRAVMKTYNGTFRMFCQWCGGIRESTHTNGLLRCPRCDHAGPKEPQEPIAARGQ